MTNIDLPFHSIEYIDEPRKEADKAQGDLFATDLRGRQLKGWTNKLIWGDNKLILSSLANGPMRGEIEKEGGLKLIYIDPPFAVGADFGFNIQIGNETAEKKQSIIEEIAYRDTWGKGISSYLSMMYERLKLMHNLLAEDGSIYVHCDWRVSSQLKLVLDDIFGKEQYINLISWQKIRSSKGQTSGYGNVLDCLFYFRKSNKFIFNKPFTPLAEERIDSHYNLNSEDGRGNYMLDNFTQAGQGEPRKFGDKIIAPPSGKHWIWTQERIDEGWEQKRIILTKNGMPRVKRYLSDSKGNPIEDLWTDIFPVNSQSDERTGYPTQNPKPY
ncbi:MAG: site-specific DNA-methyltransferase [Methylococcales bacterium]|nr:site-specific DNA-methyltransferase [Methylococcales bacterium]